MSSAAGSTIGNIRDLTDQVIARTMNALRAKLSPSEVAALDTLVTSGEFLNSAAVLSAITRAQSGEER